MSVRKYSHSLSAGAIAPVGYRDLRTNVSILVLLQVVQTGIVSRKAAALDPKKRQVQSLRLGAVSIAFVNSSDC